MLAVDPSAAKGGGSPEGPEGQITRIHHGGFCLELVAQPTLAAAPDLQASPLLHNPQQEARLAVLAEWLRHPTPNWATLRLTMPPQAVAEVLAQLPKVGGFSYMAAAGGVVAAPDGRLLLIYRRGCWDLPKGKLDPGEAPPEAALREVEEETGLPNPQLLAPLVQTHHVYPYRGSFAFKTTYWYAMAASKAHPLAPQAEEDIEAAEWRPLQPAQVAALGTYPTIEEVLQAYFRWRGQQGQADQ